MKRILNDIVGRLSLSLTFIPNSRLVSVHEPPIIIIIIAIMLPRNVFNVGMRGLGSATDYSNKNNNNNYACQLQ